MGGRAAGIGGSGKSAAPVDKEVDYAQYFCTYSFLYHQKDMLSDRVRMDAYFNAVFENKHHFAGKVRNRKKKLGSLPLFLIYWSLYFCDKVG